MGFAEILGQELAVSILKNSLKQSRLHHAYLFIGEEGVGKDKVAFEFAKAINCKQKDDDACDECLSCKKADSGNHPDLKIIEPDGTYIKIDQIRALQQEILYKPYESKKKVYIIYQAEMMTTEAANSLLKTLEDPPKHGVIILLSNNLNQLLPTVISRCEIVRFKRVANELIKEKLTRDYQLSAEKKQLITSLAFGKVNEAVKLAENKEDLAWRDEIIDLLISFKDLNRLKAFEITRKLLDSRDKISQVLDIFLTWYRDILLLKLGRTENLVNADYYKELEQEAENFTLDKVEEIIKLISKTSNMLRNVNVNLQLTLEVMLLRLNKLRRKNR